MSALFPKAIIVGGITDVVLSMLLGIPFSRYVVATREMHQIPAEGMPSAIIAAVHASVGLSLLQFTIGFSCSILGGYVAATIAKSSELLNGVLASWLCVGIGVYSILGGTLQGSLLQHLLLLLATPLCYLAGALLWLKRNRPSRLAPNKSMERTREE